jgi:endonuclease-3
MRKESKSAMKRRALAVAGHLDRLYPDAPCALHHSDPFTLTIAVLLSAQTTDRAVNAVTPRLFGRWPDPQAMASADPREVEEVIRSIGFYRVKAKNCVACAQMLCSEFAGEVPHSMDELRRLPGVGRKSANIVLNVAFGVVEGIAVDTHVFRIAHQLRFSAAKTAGATEADLLDLYPRDYWKRINHQWVLFGREICVARRPSCVICPLAADFLCPSASAQPCR